MMHVNYYNRFVKIQDEMPTTGNIMVEITLPKDNKQILQALTSSIC